MGKKNKKSRKLELGRETLKRLEDDALDNVAGGAAAGKAVTGATDFPCFSQNNCPINA